MHQYTTAPVPTKTPSVAPVFQRQFSGMAQSSPAPSSSQPVASQRMPCCQTPVSPSTGLLFAAMCCVLVPAPSPCCHHSSPQALGRGQDPLSPHLPSRLPPPSSGLALPHSSCVQAEWYEPTCKEGTVGGIPRARGGGRGREGQRVERWRWVLVLLKQARSAITGDPRCLTPDPAAAPCTS